MAMPDAVPVPAVGRTASRSQILVDPSSGRPGPPSQHNPLPGLSPSVTSSVSPPSLSVPTAAQVVPVKASQRHSLPVHLQSVSPARLWLLEHSTTVAFFCLT